MNNWSAVIQTAQTHGVSIVPDSWRPLGGGSINKAWRVDSQNGPLFVKFNTADRHDMFVAEAEGLAELSQADAIRVPQVLCHGVAADQSFLILEYIDMQPGSRIAASALGTALAKLHQQRSDTFGWHRDNTIGSTPQINTISTDWIDFFGRNRLGYQLDLTANPRLMKLGAKLCQGLPRFFEGITIEPALLHGDLWGGNWGEDENHQPVIFDPAVYYGDPESDIAMTTLFGGFPDEFYKTYRQQRPDQPGGQQRRELYRLYHVLNHYNLFGGGYAAQAEQMISRLLNA